VRGAYAGGASQSHLSFLRVRRKWGPSPFIALVLAACAGTSAEYRNFKQVMDRQVGKGIDDPDAYPVFYRLRELNSKPLQNGNLQQQYAAGRNERCRLYFEVEPRTGRIVRWSSEGSESDCVLTRSP
jgi:hypothetical protein